MTREELILENERMRKIITLAEMLIQPTCEGIKLVGHESFREALLAAIRGYKYTDPFEVKDDSRTTGT